jgi:hypothetical protein
MTTSQTIRFKRKEMETGDAIVVIKPIQNGLIELKPFDTGRIVYLQNQVKATVWFRHIGQYANNSISKSLEVDTSYGKDGRLDGLTLELKQENFAIKYRYEGCNDVTVDEDKALGIPFFVINDSKRIPSNMQRNSGNGVFERLYQYLLIDIIDDVSDSFSAWVKNNTKSRKVRKSEKENGDYPDHWDTVLTDKSQELFNEKKQELELAFAKSTGVFYEFTGGLLFD